MILEFRSVEAELGRPHFKQPVILVLYKFSVCENTMHMASGSSAIPVRTSEMQLAVSEILQFGNQFLGLHSILRNAVRSK